MGTRGVLEDPGTLVLLDSHCYSASRAPWEQLPSMAVKAWKLACTMATA